ncbi:hypothetical protein Tco_0899298 [Tanacetum coccineum]
MVLQLTDFTSEITDEELLKFTSEYYIPFALHPAVPAAGASIADFPEGKVGARTISISRLTAAYWQLIPWSICSAPSIIPLGRTDGYHDGLFWDLHSIRGVLPRDGGPPPGRIIVPCATAEPPGQDHTQALVLQRMLMFRRAEARPKRLNWAETHQGAPVMTVRAHQRGPPDYSRRLIHLKEGRETGSQAFEGMPVDQLMGEFDMVTAQQAALVAQLRARFASERGQSVQKEEEILLLKTQLVDAQAEAESSSAADAADSRPSCHWPVKVFGGGKNNHFAVDEFHREWGAVGEAGGEATQTQYWSIAKSCRGGGECMKDSVTVPAAQVPIFASPRDILNPFALEKEIPLKESLEARAIRLAKKKGVKGKAILCSVGVTERQ